MLRYCFRCIILFLFAGLIYAADRSDNNQENAVVLDNLLKELKREVFKNFTPTELVNLLTAPVLE